MRSIKTEEKAWGQLLILDLRGCNNTALKNVIKLKNFCSELCKEIKMIPYGKPLIKKFGKRKLKGYSLMQFIETSSITLHADEFENRVFIDIFSCKTIHREKAEEFSKRFFGAKRLKSKLIERE